MDTEICTPNQETLTALILQKLSPLQDTLRLQWLNPQGTKTRHFVVDGLLPDEICAAIFQAFPRDAQGFFSRNSFREKKRTSADLSAYDPILSNITYAIQDPKVIELIATITNLKNIEPDPKLYAGGLSMMFRGDYLNPHIDNSHDGERNRYRRLNLLYYVTPEWALQNGGNFELWDDALGVAKTIVSKFNRFVVMETNKSSWHSVSAVAVDATRCCVSNYYFSKFSPESSEYFHVTSFTGRPQEAGRRFIGRIDNAVRNVLGRVLKFGRGRHLINKSNE